MPSAQFSQSKVDMGYRVSEIGTAATAVLVGGKTLDLPAPMMALTYLILVGSIIYLFRSRTRDELLHKNWNSGASTAFFAICLWGILFPFLMGVFDGLLGRPKAGSEAYEIMAGAILPIAFTAFFAAFQVSRLRHG